MGEKNKSEIFREDEVLAILKKYLKEEGWKVKEQIKIDKGRIDIGCNKRRRNIINRGKRRG